MIAIIFFSLIGVLIGMTSSLFGFGGGFIVVPILYAFLPDTIPADYVMHTAIGTSLAVMIINSFNSTLNHARKGNVQVEGLRKHCPTPCFRKRISFCL
ncbi:sulfite exporter TauE/SafE family protein [Natribacillus halophilus]|uniref:Probable membrane transporter protein n=1 Tax=Natribacillus halophilus TaxID=549003 RepID=A0A1G8Q100_9BACI|nr:sulfite exporter TauE/SafE family protein [Natribacillus halophilus]SDI98422.1 Sulfite exporter TauE/SafE [Natribacillus halophilus]